MSKSTTGFSSIINLKVYGNKININSVGDLDARCIVHLKTASIGETWGRDKKREIIIKSPELSVDNRKICLKIRMETC